MSNIYRQHDERGKGYMGKRKDTPIRYAIVIACIICVVVSIYVATTMYRGERRESAVSPDLNTDLIEAPISRYFGSNSIDTDLLVYDIQVTRNGSPEIQITFKQYLEDTVFQTLSYPLREDFMPETVRDGLEVMDVNKDGIEDFLFDLGIYGKMRLKACMVYDHEAKKFVFVKDFEELNTPNFVNGYFVTAPMPMDVPRTFDRYLLDGPMLCHVGSLSISDSSESQIVYTESEQVNGKWIITKNMVTENDIDLSSWGLSPQS